MELKHNNPRQILGIPEGLLTVPDGIETSPAVRIALAASALLTVPDGIETLLAGWPPAQVPAF